METIRRGMAAWARGFIGRILVRRSWIATIGFKRWIAIIKIRRRRGGPVDNADNSDNLKKEQYQTKPVSWEQPNMSEKEDCSWKYWTGVGTAFTTVTAVANGRHGRLDFKVQDTKIIQGGG